MDLPTTHNELDAAKKAVQKDEAKPEVKKDRTQLLEKISFYIFLVTLFLAPLIFIPSTHTSPDASRIIDVVKTAVISFGILFSCIVYIISAIKSRSISFPRGQLAYSLWAIIISIVISIFISTNATKSFIGQGFEVSTGSFTLLMFVVVFFTARIVGKKAGRVFNIYTTILIAFIILALFQIARLIGGANFLSFGLLTSVASSVLGRWYDFGIFTAIAGFISFFALKFLTLRKGFKILLYVVLIVSGFLLFIINSTLIWFSVLVTALGVSVYEYLIRKPEGTGIKKFFSRVSTLTLVVLVVSVIFAWKGDVIAGPHIQKLHAIQNEVPSLPWQYTTDIAANTIKESPYFGAGPNRFLNQFLKYKPTEINLTQYWGAEFATGFGTLPTVVVTQGILGLLLWVLFLIFFVRSGIILLRKNTDPFKKFAGISSFFIASFLWLMNIIYAPMHVILFLTFVFSGIFFGMLIVEGVETYRMVSADGAKRFKKTVRVIGVLILIVFVVWALVYLKKTVAIAYFESGIRALNSQNVSPQSVATAEGKFRTSLAWDNSDVYYQALSEINILKITALAQQASQSGANQNSIDPKLVNQVASLVNEAIGYTTKAIALDPTNYYNYISQARILEIASSLQMKNAFESAEAAYGKAISINPYNPDLYLSLARLETSKNNYVNAERAIGKALELKQNYVEAIFFLSQVQVANGETKAAINSAQIATQVNPNNAIAFFQLGLLYYNDKNYSDAAQAFTKALAIRSDYANSQYFLGLSDARLGKMEDAIAQFTQLAKTNPDNQEVKFILSNLEAGRSPFTDVTPPLDSKPEKRSSLPIKSTTSDEVRVKTAH